TYETERNPHAQFWVEQAVKAADFLQTLDPEAAQQRDQSIRANPAEAAPISPPLGPGLHEGASDQRAGRLSIQPILANGIRLDDLVGPRFALVMAPELYDDLDADLRQQIESNEELIVLRDSEQADPVLQAAGAQAVLIRPDRYILSAADSPAEVERLVRHPPGLAVEAIQTT